MFFLTKLKTPYNEAYQINESCKNPRKTKKNKKVHNPFTIKTYCYYYLQRDV